jgi:hypothetical protein
MSKCPACDKEIEAGWIACPHCGVKIEGDSAIPEEDYGTLETVVERVLARKEQARSERPPAPAVERKRHWSEVFTGD